MALFDLNDRIISFALLFIGKRVIGVLCQLNPFLEGGLVDGSGLSLRGVKLTDQLLIGQVDFLLGRPGLNTEQLIIIR